MKKGKPSVTTAESGSKPPPSPSTEPELSLVVPFFNESDGVESFFEATLPVLRKEGIAFEIICVNDGSRDLTLPRLLEQRKKEPRIRILHFTRNFGKEIAISAGLDHACGHAVIPIDSDLQDPPALIPHLLAKWRDGHKIVNARRAERMSDSWLKRGTAAAFYHIFNKISDTPIPEQTGDFRLLDASVVADLRRLPERDRFMKGLFAWVGHPTAEITYERPARDKGRTSWNYWKLWNFALGGIISFSRFPLRIWNYLGLSIAVLSFLYATFLVLRTLLFGRDVPGYASLMVVMLFLGGIQLIGIGILGEYLGRVFIESKRRPLYLVQRRYGFPDKEDDEDA